MKDSRFAHLPLAAVIALLIMFGMPMLARLQPKQEDDYWRRVRPETYPASGRVLYEGGPVVDAIVVFHTTVEATGYSYSAVGSTDAEGRFWLRTFNDAYGAAAGRHQITVQKMVPTGRIIEGTAYEGGPEFPGFPGEPEMVSALPDRFADTTTSGLFTTVKAEGPNEFVIRLTKEPPPEARSAGIPQEAVRREPIPHSAASREPIPHSAARRKPIPHSAVRREPIPHSAARRKPAG